MTAGRRPSHWLLFAVVAAVGGTALLILQRGFTFGADEHVWLIQVTNHSLVEPMVGHLMVVPLAGFRAILEVFGAEYRAFSVFHVAAIVVCVGAVYEYSRRRIGPWLALAPAVVLFAFGSGYGSLLQALVGSQIVLAAAFGVLALLALERDDRAGDILCCLFLALSLASFSDGLAFAAGAAVSVGLRPDRWHRVWIPGVPVGLYLVWRLASDAGGTGEVSGLETIHLVPGFIVDSVAGVITGVFGRLAIVGSGPVTSLDSLGWDSDRAAFAFVCIALELVALAFIVRRVRRRGPIPASFWVAAAVPLVAFTLRGLVFQEGRSPTEIRYLFPEAVAMTLFLTEAARGIRVSRLGIAATALLTLAAVVGNAPRFEEGRESLGGYSREANAIMAAYELAGERAPQDYSPGAENPDLTPFARFFLLTPGEYELLNNRYGLAGLTPEELEGADESSRLAADAHLLRIVGLALHDARGRSPANCKTAQPTAADEVVELALPSGPATVESATSAPLSLRRFAEGYGPALTELSPGRPLQIELPADSSDTPWRASVTGAALTVCETPG